MTRNKSLFFWEIKKTVGEKIVRKCPMLEGVSIAEGSKDELVISGNDIENVSQSAASITDRCRVKEKDVSWLDIT